jgi:hypothetical protein
MCVRDVFLRPGFGLVRCLPAIFLVLTAAAPAKADFLDDLFGGGSSETPAPAARARPAHASRDNFSIRLKDSRRAQQRSAHTGQGDGGPQYSAGSRPQKPLLCGGAAPAGAKPDDKTGESTAYLRDETLRAGDSVVTPDQIVVFKGGGGCPHASGDFVSLTRSGLPKIKRNALVSLQQSLKAPGHFGTGNDRQAGPKIAGEANE